MFSKNRAESKLTRAIKAKMPQIILLLERYNPKPNEQGRLDLEAFFNDLQELLLTKELHGFLLFLQNSDNIPLEYGDLESMSIERFNSLLDLWLDRVKPEEE